MGPEEQTKALRKLFLIFHCFWPSVTWSAPEVTVTHLIHTELLLGSRGRGASRPSHLTAALRFRRFTPRTVRFREVKPPTVAYTVTGKWVSYPVWLRNPVPMPGYQQKRRDCPGWGRHLAGTDSQIPAERQAVLPL